MKIIHLFLSSCLLIAGCSTRPKEFDYRSQTRVDDLVQRAQLVMAESARGRLTEAESERFLEESIGIVGALYAREEWDRNEKRKLASLAALKAHLEKLLKRKTKLRPADAPELGLYLGEVKERYRWLHRYTSDETTDITFPEIDTSERTEEGDKGKRDRDDGRKDRGEKRRN